MTTNNDIRIGTLIHGTLQDEDLLEAFANELERISDGSYSDEIAEARTMVKYGITGENGHGDTASEVIINLIDILNGYAPPHVYFGAHAGDGSDFGYWPIGDDWDNCSGHWVSKNVFIDHDCRVFVQINDHGNITVSELRGKEIWSAV